MYNGCPTVKWISLFLLLGLSFCFRFIPDYFALVSYGVLISFGVLVSDDFLGDNVLGRASPRRQYRNREMTIRTVP